jgi:hypothetical protein
MDNQQDEKRKTSNRSPPYAIFNLLVIFVAILYGVYYQIYQKDAEINQTEQPDTNDYKIPMFTADELAQYNGEGIYFLSAILMAGD